ncbi:Transcriptional regulator, TetR family [Paenibacillus pasadenensis]|uniref:Transcriptional regulator, TetR family n=1 Tax=Paenibacillus pasadenensis TaxID=217090 RepID=A0A2N5N2E5_9BACL|nr:TetR/AcrR family transcriptional regulator [Paenibacillus pasadenensis]PLT44486.1 Transcriptional regulator, TetR family [Paenibacillus pasadenensis]
MPIPDKRKGSRELSASILDTARSLFAEHGVDAVSMHQIAKAAGVGQGTLYRRYAQKGDLCLCLMEEEFHRLRESILVRLEALAGEPPCVRLAALATLVVEHLIADSRIVEAMHTAIYNGRNTFKEIEQFYESPPYRFLYETIQALLDEARIKGQTIEAVDPAVSAHLLISLFSPQSLLHLHEKLEVDPEEIIRRIVCTAIRPLFRAE